MITPEVHVYRGVIEGKLVIDLVARVNGTVQLQDPFLTGGQSNLSSVLLYKNGELFDNIKTEDIPDFTLNYNAHGGPLDVVKSNSFYGARFLMDIPGFPEVNIKEGELDVYELVFHISNGFAFRPEKDTAKNGRSLSMKTRTKSMMSKKVIIGRFPKWTRRFEPGQVRPLNVKQLEYFKFFRPRNSSPVHSSSKEIDVMLFSNNKHWPLREVDLQLVNLTMKPTQWNVSALNSYAQSRTYYLPVLIQSTEQDDSGQLIHYNSLGLGLQHAPSNLHPILIPAGGIIGTKVPLDHLPINEDAFVDATVYRTITDYESFSKALIAPISGRGSGVVSKSNQIRKRRDLD